ncbi:hypothetical protein H4R26_001880 [Coemansia thaxteri]|uniref:Uncharacterized protein n=1 Tax=Coemansia thaxteri TaxID=2663907 RepID=A0A9W8BDX7_9FUNG|nr:hypothetical protein H4R26_001880 [Coemansia thaxteri]
MSTAQPFPVLGSADNSRSASPAHSVAGSKAAQRGKGAGRGGSKARHKRAAAAAAAAVAVAGNVGGLSGADNERKKPGADADSRQTPPPQQARRRSADGGGSLAAAVIVAGENGRARVLFSTAGQTAGPPPEFRKRSLTSTQLRVTAPEFTPQRAQPPQPLQTAHASQPIFYPHTAPLSAPPLGGRARSQSTSAHVSLTGLRITMAQARAGNVLAPLAAPQAYSGSGYFGTRRASVSSAAGVAADPAHAIRIPAELFQKQTGADAGDGESPAMRRLQEMISSMRALGPPAPAPPADLPHVEPADPPAAHPTARFDSILEEDEDADDDEANLDDDEATRCADDAPSAAAALALPPPHPKAAALFAV